MPRCVVGRSWMHMGAAGLAGAHDAWEISTSEWDCTVPQSAKCKGICTQCAHRAQFSQCQT